MDDLVERLRTAVTYGYMPRRMREVADEAADRITALEAQLAAINSELESALCAPNWAASLAHIHAASGAYRETPHD